MNVFDEKNSRIFSPYNGLQWEPNGSRSKRKFQCKLQTVQRALNDSRRLNRVLSSETICFKRIESIKLIL